MAGILITRTKKYFNRFDFPIAKVIQIDIADDLVVCRIYLDQQEYFIVANFIYFKEAEFFEICIRAPALLFECVDWNMVIDGSGEGETIGELACYLVPVVIFKA